MPDRTFTRPLLGLVPALVAVCLILTAATTVAATASQRKPTPHPTRPIRPVLPPKPHKVPHTTRRESRAVVRCLRGAHLKPVVTSGVGFLWEGWIRTAGSFVYAQYFPTRKEATQQAKQLQREESGLAHRIVISQHVSPYVGSPVPQIVRCLHGRMITKQPKGLPPPPQRF